jgi:hypothetical protein
MALHASRDAEQARPTRSSRVLAACAYLFGAYALVIVALNLNRPFLMRHAQLAMVLHVLRLVLVATAIVAWYAADATGSGSASSGLALHLGMLTLAGIPWPWAMSSELLLVLGLPLGGTWVLAIAGATVSALGLSLDLRAMVSSVWPDQIDESEPEMGTAEYYRRLGFRNIYPTLGDRTGAGLNSDIEMRIARALRDRRLERLWDASRVAALERDRDTLRQELEARQATVLVRLDYLNHLLSAGEISLSRFNRLHQ